MPLTEFDTLLTNAETAVSEGNWAAAAAAYEASVQRQPHEIELKYELARAYEHLGRFDDAIELLNHPSLAGRSKSKRRLAAAYVRAKKYTAAMPLLDELLTEMPGSSKYEAWMNLCKERTSPDNIIAARIEEGQALISADRLEEAEQLYLGLVAEDPSIARAHFHLGRIYNLQKRWADSIPPLRAGLALEPGNDKLRKALARALYKNGDAAEALSLLDNGELADRDLDALLMVQQCHAKLQNWDGVDDVGARLLVILPQGDPRRETVSRLREDALVEKEAARCGELAQAGNLDAAISRLTEIAERYPNAAQAWLKLGTALADADRNEEAIAALSTAQRLRPEDSKVHERLSRAIIKTGDEERIFAYVQDAISAQSADFECYRWLAQYYYKRYEWQVALENAQLALAIFPDHASVRLLMARALTRLSRLAEALDELNALLARGVHRIVTLQLKGDTLVRLARLDDAIELYREGLAKAPDHPLLNQRLSYALLLKGDIAGFHSFHEKRRQTKTFLESNKDYPFFEWNGELAIEGKLLVWSEVGLGVGQNILHMTFLKSLVALGLDVVFEVEPRMVDLCRRSFPDVCVIASDSELPAGISHHTPIGSLSRWFKPDLASFERMRPFFLPDAEAVAAHRAGLQDAAGKKQILIGISWTSTNPFVGDVKSVQLDQLLNALSVPGVTLVNLQYGNHSEPIARAEAATGKRLMDSGIDNSNDLDGLAAVVAAMDLVVCIGHTTAHMAGAVGTPNFVLLPAAPFAHWLAEGERCIWYPESTLFRQSPIDDNWSAVLDKVRSSVVDFASGYDANTWLGKTLLLGPRPSVVHAEPMSQQEVRDAVLAFVHQGAYRSALKLMDRLGPEQQSQEMAVLRADMLALIGRWDEAKSLYLSLRPSADDKHAIDRKLLEYSLVMYGLEDALPLARRLAEEDPAYRLTAANILYHVRRHEEALAELRTLSMQAPQTEGLSTLTGNVLLEMGAIEQAEAYLAVQAAVTRRAEDYTLLGRALAAQGRHEEAIATYDKAIAVSKYNPAAHFWRTQERIDLGLVPLAALPPVLGERPNVSPDDVVVFIAVDNTYFWWHGLVLIGSAARRSPRAKCHVHVINPGPSVPKAIEAIRQILPDLSLSFTYEHADLNGCSDIHVRTYYASVRFVRLAEIFAQSPAFYLCVDADGIVRDEIAEPQFRNGVADVALYMRYHSHPQMAVLASASILRPTPAATKFMNRVGELIKRTLEAREAVWFLDQIVLGHVVRELGNGEVDISLLDVTYLDWFFQDHTLIWTAKGKRKSDNTRYRAEVAKYEFLKENEQISAMMPQLGSFANAE